MVCFDTSFIIDLMREAGKKEKGPATLKMEEFRERKEIPRTTIITVSELYVGPNNVKNSVDELEKLEKILLQLDILELDIESARLFGKITATLNQKGIPIGALDTYIASIVIENDEILVTRNTSHFENIPNLRIESY